MFITNRRLVNFLLGKIQNRNKSVFINLNSKISLIVFVKEWRIVERCISRFVSKRLNQTIINSVRFGTAWRRRKLAATLACSSYEYDAEKLPFASKYGVSKFFDNFQDPYLPAATRIETRLT